MSDLKKLLFLFLLCMVFFSCGGDSKSELLTQDKWQVIDKLIYNPLLDIETSDPSDCQKDDVYSFDMDGRYEINKNSMCNPNDINESGSWEIDEDENQIIIISDSGFSIVYTIEKLSENRLEIYYQHVLSNELVWKYTTVLSH